MRCQCPIGSPQLLRHVDRYSLQPPLCLGDGACSHQLVEEGHHSGAVPCLLLRSLSLQQANTAKGYVGLCAARSVICAISKKGDVWLGLEGHYLWLEKSVPHPELGGTLGLATINAIADASVVEAHLVAGAPHAQ